MTERVGRYRVLGRLGEGGMGVVLSAVDETLDRPVAIKRLRAREAGDVVLRERLLREARAAASLSHPNICQIFEVGEDAEGPYLVMELLEGEPLEARIGRGPMPLVDAAPIAFALLSALAELDRRHWVHRDLKPSNVFLTPQGPKLLDFGLVRPTPFDLPNADTPTFQSLTGTGLIVGTPRYMSPEQLRGEPLDARSDQFAFGALCYEMLAGKPAFGGDAGADVVQAILSEQPRALVGSEAIAAVNRILLRALAKRRDDRYANPETMRADLERALALSDAGALVAAKSRSRLAVLPLKVVPPGSDGEFLGHALAESIAASLAGLESVTVRLAPAPGGAAADDWRARGKALEVDLLLAGTLWVSGRKLRATCQLIEAESGALLGSCTAQGDFDDLFAFEDALVQRVSDSLALPFSEREQRLTRREVPRNAAAHEFFLRAQELRPHRAHWAVARELYRRAVDEDSRYAPAWAGLARVDWLLGKYAGDSVALLRAEAEVRRALELAPELPAAHGLAAEIDLGSGRPLAALERLLERLRERALDVDLLASLVAACRYCGLLDASLAADRECRRLDPKRPTSVSQTWALLDEWDLAHELSGRDFGYLPAHCLVQLGRSDDALAWLRAHEPQMPEGAARHWLVSLRARLEGDRVASREALEAISSVFPDPEGLFFVAAGFVALGDHERGLAELERCLALGFAQPEAMASRRWMGELAGGERLAPLVARAADSVARARARFDDLGGPRLLGLAISLR
jgi:TolB-like protein